MKLYVYSHKEFNNVMFEKGWLENSNIPSDCAYISICNTDAIIPYVSDDEMMPHWFNSADNVFNVDFDDITSTTDDIGCLGISELQAKQLVQFIIDNYGKHLYIHCSAGKSRSQGVARFILDCGREIAEYLNIDNVEYETRVDNPCLTPNYFVVSVLKQIWRNNYSY